MKKVFTIVVMAAIMLLAGKANAQITIHAGWQDASYKLKWSETYEGQTYSGSESISLTGFYAGATYDYDLGMASIFITPGAEFSYCTYNKNNFDLKQLDLRIRIWGRWNKQLTEKIVFGVFAGPSVNIGLSGNVYDDEGGLKRVDLGLTFGAQVRYNRIGIEAGYNLGLLNRFKQPDGANYSESIKFHTIFVGLNFII